jgi:hypothetical protein
MGKEELATKLRGFYAQTKRRISLGESEFILENLFGIENLKAFVAEQFEEVYKDFFVDKKANIEKRVIFSYDDPYDFINTLLKIDINDLIIFFTHEEIIEYTISLMHTINRALNFWTQHRKSGFRKGTKIFLEMDKGGIHLYLKPEIKT